MSVSSRHILSQGRVLAALGRTVFEASRQALGAASRGEPPLPGPEVRASQPPLPRGLVEAYLRFLGSDPRSYRDHVPPHLFPQWCMPSLARTLQGVPYPLLQVLNGGCRLRVGDPLAAGEATAVRAYLAAIDDDGRRAVLHQRAQTGTLSAPAALTVDLFAIVPLPRTQGGADGTAPPRKSPARVPEGARELMRIRLPADAGLSFAKLTGDFNPIHWLGPYARAAGHRTVILHGFASLAFAWEGLVRALLGGDVHALRELDAKFSRPLRLPHEVGLYIRDDAVYLGDMPGGPAYLQGTFQTRG